MSSTFQVGSQVRRGHVYTFILYEIILRDKILINSNQYEKDKACPTSFDSKLISWNVNLNNQSKQKLVNINYHQH